jgi:hypothetical protein
MPLFSYREKCCGTCRHWQGGREDVSEIDGHVFDRRSVEGYVFCFKDVPGDCRLKAGDDAIPPQLRCTRWETVVGTKGFQREALADMVPF